MIEEKIFNDENAPNSKTALWNKMRCRQDLSNNMRRKPDFPWWVVFPIDIVWDSLLTNHSPETSFFN